MGYNVLQRFIPASSYPLKSPYEMKPEYITFHNTANDASALGEIAYMTGNKNATSYHVAIDDKNAVEAIPFRRMAWHCGDSLNGTGNRKSIGIEVCYSKSGGAKYKAAEANAIDYIARVLVQYGWGVERVKWHRDWSGKNCPHRVFAEGREKEVLQAIAERVKELKQPIQPKEEKAVAKTATTSNAPSKWAKADVEKAVELGITDGSRLHDPVTRQEAIVLIMRAVALIMRAAGLGNRIKTK